MAVMIPHRLEGNVAGNDFEVEPRAELVRLKSLSPHQPAGWNDPYRSRKRIGAPLDKRFVVEVYHFGSLRSPLVPVKDKTSVRLI
jgi:hypothetical protein